MTKSMTGFAAQSGTFDTYSWSWEIRSVNAKGLDIRMRMPEWIAGLDQAARKAVSARAARGNIALNLRVTRDQDRPTEVVDTQALAQVLAHLAEIDSAAQAAGVAVMPPRTSDILTIRGILTSETQDEDTKELLTLLLGPVDNHRAAMIVAQRYQFAA